MTTEQITKYQESATVTFRNKSDHDVFKKLLEVQSESADDFVTKAVYDYIILLLDDPKRLRNPNADSLKGICFGGPEEELERQPKVGDVSIETSKGYDGKISSHKSYFITTIQGEAAELYGRGINDSALSSHSIKIKGREAWQIWMDE